MILAVIMAAPQIAPAHRHLVVNLTASMPRGLYLLSPEARAAGEAPCYAAGVAVRVACGASLEEAVADAKRSLTGYGLDADAMRLAVAMIDGAAVTIAATFNLIDHQTVSCSDRTLINLE